MKKTLGLLCLWMFVLLALTGCAAGETIPFREGHPVRTYESDTLRYTVRRCTVRDTVCYLTEIWMANPGRQIVKASSPFGQALARAEDLAKACREATLVINGSGYVSPVYPDIPADYPGISADYYYTPLGSLAVTDGQVLRLLEGVAYIGLTLEEDGLHMVRGEDPQEVLRRGVKQTWAFYPGCPLIAEGKSVLDRDWAFAKRRVIRNVIARVDENNYVNLIATATYGLTLPDAVDFLLQRYPVDWAFNLDGGPSAALFVRRRDSRYYELVYGAGQQIVDVMGFTE